MSVNEAFEISGPSVKARRSTHESGQDMLVLFPFWPQDISSTCIQELIASAMEKLGQILPTVRICLDPSQEVERSILEKMGFRLDGVEFGIEVERLIELLGPTRTTLPHGYQILAMDYGRDIEQVVKLETEVHAADKSSRVNFDNETAVRSMMDYYKKACSGNGVFLLRHGNRLVGLVGFMPDQERENAVHISSVALALPQQGTGLFFPLTLNALEISQYASAKKLTGVTTTKRLLDAAQKYSFEVLGLSLSLSSK